MATVIDSLVVELGLDPKGAQKGAADFQGAIKKTRDVAGTGAKDIEAYGKKASAFFSSLRNEAIGLFLAFQGASSITGFVSDLLHGDAATGRFAANIGMATSRLSAWQLAVQEMGGDSKDATAALGAMRQMFMSWQLTGDTGHNADLLGLGVDKKSLADPEQALLKLAEAAEKLPKVEFYARASRLGIPDSVINTLEKGRKGVEALVREKERDGAASQKDADAAAEYERQMAKMSAHIKGVLRPEIYELVKGFDKLLGKVTDGTIKLPSMTLALEALGAMAVVIDAPLIALGAALAIVVTNWEKWQNMGASARTWVDDFLGGRDANAPAGPAAPAAGDGPGLQMFDEQGRRLRLPGDGYGATPSQRAAGAAGAGMPGFNAALMRGGFDAEQAAGIRSGVIAEGGSFGFSSHVGKHGERAFGIGQWLGPRQKALFAKYGPSPTPGQQVEFLISELNGGDHGGASVHAGRGADDTMVRYLRDFMRPQGKHNERAIDLTRDIQRGRQALARGGRYGAGGGGGSNVSVGAINIHTPTTNPAEHGRIARDAIRRRLIAAQGNRGMDN